MLDVSVIMPARNAASTIQRALQSVLENDHLAEIIVVDDGSSDGTGAVALALKDARVRVMSGPASGVADALNTGIDAATGAFVARCDADDWWSRDRLAWQRDWLMSHPEFIAVSGGLASATGAGEHVADLAIDMPGFDVTETLLNGQTVTSLCTWLIRSPALRQTGGARRWFKTSSDLDLQFRLAETGQVWHEPVICYHYTLHDGSITHSQASGLRVFYEENSRRFARQRQKDGTDDLSRGVPPVYVPQDTSEKPSTSSAQIASHLAGQAWASFGRKEYRAALQKMLRALRHAPTSAVYWRGLAVLLVKSAMRR